MYCQEKYKAGCPPYPNQRGGFVYLYTRRTQSQEMRSGTSVLMVLSACTTCIREVHAILTSLERAPDEVLAVANGLTDLAVVLDHVKIACEDVSGTGRVGGAGVLPYQHAGVFYRLLSDAHSKLDQSRSIVRDSTNSNR